MRLSPLTNNNTRISELLDIELFAAQQGVELMLSDRGSYIALQWIKNHSRTPGKGAEIMEMICRHADQHRRTLRLTVMDSPALVAYYEKFGFLVISPSPDTEMIRAPK